MGGVFVLGFVLTLMGLSVMSGLMIVMVDWMGNLLVIGGIVTAVAGGIAMLFGSAARKLVGLGFLMLGVAVAVMGVIVKFVLHLWLVQWLMEFGGGVMLVIGIIMAIIGLIGMFKGGERQRYAR